MGILGSKTNTYLGIDLSPDSIKMVELISVGGKAQLVTYGYTESKGEILTGDFITNKNVTSTLLKEVSDRAKVTTNQVLAALPPAVVFTTVSKLSGIFKRDLDNRTKLKAQLSEELKKILPRPLEEMTFDFNLVKDEAYETADRNAKIDTVRFLITAASNDVVKNYVEIFKQSGFSLTNLDIESFALVRSLVGTDKSLVMLVDIGENRTNLSIVNLTIPVLNRTIGIGGATVTRALADSMKITVAEAESYKLDLGIMMAQQNLTAFPKPVADALSPIVTEIKYLLKNYYDQFGKNKLLDKVVLTGGTALLGNYLDKYLSAEMNIRTYVGDPWARVIYPEELKPILQEIGPRFAVAVGLAMREIV